MKTTVSLNQVNCDWQITAILADNLLIQTDCNSGEKRRIRRTQCLCGEAMLIEYNAKTSCRRDKKRVFYADDDANSLWGAVRCRGCSGLVKETVVHAEMDDKELC